MRLGEVASGELIAEGRRLNGGFFLSEDEQAFRVLRNWPGPSTTLDSLAKSGGIFTGGIFRKLSASGPDHGAPYVSARAITKSDIHPNGYLSHKQGNLLSVLALVEGMVLITCSGMNLGESVWVRRDMEGLVGSGDLIRIRLDADQVAPGFVFAFLSSRYGYVAIRKLIYGGHIRHISPKDVAGIRVPRLSKETETRASELVTAAADLRVRASAVLRSTYDNLAAHLNVPSPVVDQPGEACAHAVPSKLLTDELRLEAFFYNQAAMAVDDWCKNHPNGYWQLSEVADVFDVPPFKHIYVASDRGAPFFTSGELFSLNRAPQKFLSRSQTKDLKKYVIKKDWVLLARSGQLGGILGRPVYAASDLDHACVSDHAIRLVPKPGIPAGYLYAYLAIESLGYVLLTRTMAGASVPALWPSHLRRVPVVKSDSAFMSAIHTRVVSASEMRVEATAKEAAARILVERSIEEGS